MDVPDSCGVDPYNGTHHCSGLHANSHLSADGFLGPWTLSTLLTWGQHNG